MRRASRQAAWLIITALLWLTGCASALPPTGAAWQEEVGGTVPPEIARFNDLLSQLAERLKTGLVQIRVERAAREAQPEESRPSPEEPRRASGSGF